MEDQTPAEPASPEVQARIRASFERQGLMRHLGARLAHVAPGRDAERAQIVRAAIPNVQRQLQLVRARQRHLTEFAAELETKLERMRTLLSELCQDMH